MLDINYVRENPEKIKKGIKNKNFDPKLVDKILKLDRDLRDLMTQDQAIKAVRNDLAHNRPGDYPPEVVKVALDLLKIKKSSFDVNEIALKLKSEMKMFDEKVESRRNEFIQKLNQLPNLPADDVPVGKNDKDNIEIKKWGKIPEFNFEPKDHLELGTNLGILDFETGAKVAGSQFYYLYGDGVLLEMALLHYALEILIKEGFLPVITPDLAKSRYYLGTGYNPKGNEAQTYVIEGEDLGLIATAEVTLAGKHADEVIPEDKLPLKYIGYSHCFRQEAGAYGKYSKGLYRVHQFSKAEMFIYCRPEDSQKFHQELLAMEEKLYQGLGLSYRVLEMCTGDLGAMAAKKYDCEAWMPGRNDYGEISSASNVTDYQARNLNIKYKTKEGKNEFVHMLNGTAIVMTRIPLAILENYQNKDGSVTVPEVLRKWMGKDKIVKDEKRT